MTEFFVVLQLFVALVLGSLLGVERSLAHKSAGMRTYGLVSMAAALFVIAARVVLPELSNFGNPDVLRVVAGVITGIGFLGAGVIIFRNEARTITGLTTAAGLWVSAGIGVAVGFELYTLAVAATVLTLLAFTVFWYIEHHVRALDDEAPVDTLDEGGVKG